MDVAQLGAIWLHTLAFVIAWGCYRILGRIVLPSLERSLDGPALARVMVTIERSALPLVGLSAARPDEPTRASALRGVRLSAAAATGLGALIVLLTAAAQLSG